MNFQLEYVRTVLDHPVLGPTGSGAWIPDYLPDFGLDIGQYKPSGDDGRTDVGDDTCGFDIADTAVETCVRALHSSCISSRKMLIIAVF